jgi:hypothetical protein
MLPRSWLMAPCRSATVGSLGSLSQVELRRFELLTPCVQSRCSPSELQPHASMPQRLNVTATRLGGWLIGC